MKATINWKKPTMRIFPFILVVATIILYYPALSGEFVLDDNTYFVNNDILTKLTPRDVSTIFLYPSNYWGELLPVRDYLYVLEYNAFGTWARGYHIVSLTIFLLSILSLFYFVYILFEKDNHKMENFSWVAASFVTVLLVFNPFYAEPVAWISGQKDLLALFFTIVSLIFLFKTGRVSTTRPWLAFAGGVLCYYLGILSKFSILPLAVFIPLLWLVHGDLKRKELVKRLVLWVLAHIPVILWLYYNMTTTAMFVKQTTMAPFLERLPRALNLLGMHISHLVWPENLSFEYVYSRTWELNIYFFIGLFLLIGIIVLLFKRKKSYITLGLLFFVLFLLPVLQILPEMPNGHIYNRYLSIPLIGVFIGMVGLLKVYFSAKRTSKILSVILLVLVLGSWGYITRKQISTFQSGVKLTENIYNTNPDWIEAKFKYMFTLIQHDELDYAKFLLQSKIDFQESSGCNEYFLGVIYKNQGDLVRGKNLLIAASIKQTSFGMFPYANYELAKILVMEGDFATARMLLNEQLLHPKKSQVQLIQTRKLLDFIEIRSRKVQIDK